MSTLYLIALGVVCLVVLAIIAEAVFAVSRAPVWGQPRQMLRVVETEERRTLQLPFVGTERRDVVATPDEAEEVVRKRA